MNTKAELLAYTLLIVVAAALSFFLVRDVLTARAERAEVQRGEKFEIPEIEVDLPDPTPMETAVAVFQERNLFADLNELLPTPTKVILPTPTPTIEPLCTEWVVTAIIGKVAQIQPAGSKKRPYRAGNMVPKDGGIHKLVKIDAKKKRVLMQRTTDGVWGWLYKGGGAEMGEGPLPQ